MATLLPPSKTLVLLFDGTGNFFNKENTNIVRLLEALKKDEPDRQLIYYQSGIGMLLKLRAPSLYSNPLSRYLCLPDDLVGKYVSLDSDVG